MNEPIKIIHKYKNNYKKIHYNLYIFLGQLVPSNIKKILEKIKDSKLYDSLIDLESNEVKALESYYGEYWYHYFYISKHIEYTFDIILKNPQKLKDLIKKFNKEWIDKHANIMKVKQKTMYSFQSIVKKQREIKDRILLKHKKINIVDEVADFTTKNIILNQGGGNIDEDEEDEIDTEVEESITDLINVDDLVDIDNETNLEELIDLYKTSEIEIDKDAQNTAKILNDIVEGPSKKEQYIYFDTSNMNIQVDEDEKNIYKKNYIYSQYIYIDDSIKLLKQKICVSIINNEKIIGNTKHNPYLLPTRQYLWCSHKYIDLTSKEVKTEKVMIGQKWIRRNDLLTIDIEPNENLHIYENLRGNLKYLKDSMKKYGNKIKREDDEYHIISDYKEYMSLNEIYMMDIYNDLGINYVVNGDDKEIIKNIYEVYIRIYYNGISLEEFIQIIDYLQINGNNRKNEIVKIQQVYNTINNDIILENEITKTVEETRLENKKYDNFFKDSYITQSVIYINIQFTDIYKTKTTKLDLFRIFDAFVNDEKYPFIQYLAPDSQIVFKFYSDASNLDKTSVINKWFENSPYGLSFKVKVDLKGIDKYISININENGRIEYKTQWKEEDMATIDDVYKTFNYIKNLLEKINNDNKKIQIKIPINEDYKFAFINKIEGFTFPSKHTINHNDLSDFARYFYPYIALCIDPRKRISKKSKIMDDKSKYGTYLRYKRVTNYESKARLDERIKHFFRNYEFNDKDLSIELSKQFNITEKQAFDAIINFRNKYPSIRKSRKIVKKLENLPKYKPPGIGIDIQGKLKENYKIRISGARNKEQMDIITDFIHILLYLYYDTYLEKNPKRVQLINKLKQLTHIAKRRNKVEELVDEEGYEKKTIKEMTAIDKGRIGYKPIQGQNQWSRLCQNSGTKKRQPKLFTSENMKAFNDAGYKYNKDNGQYERKVIQGKKELTLKAFQAKSENGTIFYTCSPEENKRYMYVGFLSKSNNPHGHCMPCCFKKNADESNNKTKKIYHKKCMGELDVNGTEKKLIGDKLYILQDTNKLQEYKFGYLPQYLDIFLNKLNRKSNIIKNHFLIESKTGYFLKLGIKQDEFNFLRSICAIYDITLEELKEKIIKGIEKDKDDVIFTSLNMGDIKTQFVTKENYINYINTNEYLAFEYLYDIISIPKIISEKGVNIILFEKKQKILYEDSITREKIIKDDYIIRCSYLYDNRDNIMIMKYDELYFPIFEVKKETINDKVILNRYINDEILKQIKEYYNKTCNNDIIKLLNKYTIIDIKQLNKILLNYETKYNIYTQIIDNRNKVKYVILKNNYLLPVLVSGSLYNITIEKNINKYIKNFLTTIDNLMHMNKMLKSNIYKIESIIVDNNKKDNFIISGIKIDNIIIPCIEQKMNKKEVYEILKKYNIKDIIFDKTPIYDLVDIEIINKNFIIDKRGIEANKVYYENEAYQIFRLELSDYLINNDNIKKNILKILDLDMNKQDKRYRLREIIYNCVSSELSKEFENNFKKEQKGGSKNDIIIIRSNDIDYYKYKKENVIELCEINNKNECEKKLHCEWKDNICKLGLNIELAIKFINKVVEELVENSIKASDILRRDNYYVSDIVSYDIFTHRNKQKIIKSSNMNTKKILSELFGEDNIPMIGRRKMVKNIEIIDENIENPLKKFGDQYIQNIIPNNISIYRALANVFYWHINKLYDIEYRNLGYYSILQTDLGNYIRGNIVDYINNTSNRKNIIDELKQTMNIIDETFINIIINNNEINTEYKIELLIISKILCIPINVYNEFQNFVFGFNNGKCSLENKDAMNLQYFYYENKYPSTISCIYNI
jgi:hypothetical protein